MKRFNHIFRILGAVLFLAAGFTAAGCSDDEHTEPAATEGVVFELSMHRVYAIESMTDIASVKVTLRQQDGAALELPSLRLSGTEDLVSTEPYRLAPGTYEFASYIAYDASSNQLFKAELYEDNILEVKAGEITTFALPQNIKVVAFPTDYYRNALYGFCKEIFGDDKEAWPFDFEKKDLRKMQKRHREIEYLEFEEDDDGNILYLSSLNFSGEDFAVMTDFPAHLFENFGLLGNITLSGLPNLKTISGIEKLPTLTSININNTGLEALPEGLFTLKKMLSLVVTNTQIAEFPAKVTQFEDLRLLHLPGNRIERIDTPLTGLKKLEDVDFSNNPLTTIGDNVFGPNMAINNIVLENTQLSALPDVIGRMALLRGINIAKGRFTAVPRAIAGNTNLRTVRLAGNPLTTVNAADFNSMTNLHNLVLSDMAVTISGKLEIPNLLLLAMNNCGLREMPDLSGLTYLAQLELGGNDFTAITDFSKFPANAFQSKDRTKTALHVISLNNSKNLTSLTAFEGKQIAADDYVVFDVSDCPKLQWQLPAAWKPFDLYLGEYTGLDENGMPAYEHIFGPTKGRAAVDRKNSPGVTY